LSHVEICVDLTIPIATFFAQCALVLRIEKSKQADEPQLLADFVRQLLKNMRNLMP
jgi:hypothetical protein